MGRLPKNLNNLAAPSQISSPLKGEQTPDSQKQQISVVVHSVKIEDRSAEVVPKLLKINAIADRIKRLRDLQERLRDCKQRILARRGAEEGGPCKCRLNMIRTCSGKCGGKQMGEADLKAFVEPLVGKIKERVRQIREENQEETAPTRESMMHIPRP